MVFIFDFFSLVFFLIRQALYLTCCQHYIFPSSQRGYLTTNHAIHPLLLRKKGPQKELFLIRF